MKSGVYHYMDFVKCHHCEKDEKVVKTASEVGKEIRFLACGHQSVMHIRYFNENIRLSDHVSVQFNTNDQLDDTNS